jgi:hypothetical protein
MADAEVRREPARRWAAVEEAIQGPARGPVPDGRDPVQSCPECSEVSELGQPREQELGLPWEQVQDRPSGQESPQLVHSQAAAEALAPEEAVRLCGQAVSREPIRPDRRPTALEPFQAGVGAPPRALAGMAVSGPPRAGAPYRTEARRQAREPATQAGPRDPAAALPGSADAELRGRSPGVTGRRRSARPRDPAGDWWRERRAVPPDAEEAVPRVREPVPGEPPGEAWARCPAEELRPADLRQAAMVSPEPGLRRSDRV